MIIGRSGFCWRMLWEKIANRFLAEIVFAGDDAVAVQRVETEDNVVERRRWRLF